VKLESDTRKAEIGKRNWKSEMKRAEIRKVELEKRILQSRNGKIKL
jgi:hypothetical protein